MPHATWDKIIILNNWIRLSTTGLLPSMVQDSAASSNRTVIYPLTVRFVPCACCKATFRVSEAYGVDKILLGKG